MPMPQPVNLTHAFQTIPEPWQPRVAARLNGQEVKLARLRGEFVWHHHADADELFLVIRGRFRMEFREGTVVVAAGEFLVVPRGVEHRPVADQDCEVLLFEPAGTRNTGEEINERTAATRDL